MVPIDEAHGVRYGLCEESDLDEMAILLGEVFSRSDPPAVAAGITPGEFEAFVRLLLPTVEAGGLTIVARSADTGDMVGALLAEDSAAELPAGLDGLSPKFDPVTDILGQLEAEYWQGKERDRGHCLHLFLLGVASSAGGRGVAQQLVERCVENGVRKGYRVGVTEATNAVSQHIFRKLGFVDRVQRSYQDHRYQGQAVFASIDGHAGPILMDRQLS